MVLWFLFLILILELSRLSSRQQHFLRIMCRWFLYLGDPVLLYDVIIKPNHGIVSQVYARLLPNIDVGSFSSIYSAVQRNSAINGDGFGIGWYLPTCNADPRLNVSEPCVFVSCSNPWSSPNLTNLAKKTLARCIFAHIRAASPGLSVSDVNCHPFRFGSLLFMHNGGIPCFKRFLKSLINRLSQAAVDLVDGTTDSEYCGALFVDLLHGPQWKGDFRTEYSLRELETAMEATIDTLIEIADLSVSDTTCKYHTMSLNFAVSNGDCVVATRFRNSSQEDPPSLYMYRGDKIDIEKNKIGEWDYSWSRGKSLGNVMETMKKSGGVSVIASEPLSNENLDQWVLVPANHMVLIDSDRCFEVKRLHVRRWVNRLWKRAFHWACMERTKKVIKERRARECESFNGPIDTDWLSSV